MNEVPNFTRLAHLLADPTRAMIISALASGKALTAGELANYAGVTPQTASAHLAKLEMAGVITLRRQGRHHYFFLENEDLIELLERMGNFQAGVNVPTGPTSQTLCEARVCYNHLAGRLGVSLFDKLVKTKAVIWSNGQLALGQNNQIFTLLGISEPKSQARECLDWSERRSHLGGPLGRQLLDAMFIQRYVYRGEGRELFFTPKGKSQLSDFVEF